MAKEIITKIISIPPKSMCQYQWLYAYKGISIDYYPTVKMSLAFKSISRL